MLFTNGGRPPSLKTNVFWAFVANGAAAGFSWLMLMVLTKVAGPSDVGLFALAQAVALPIHTFFTFKLRVIQATDHACEFTDDEYRTFRIISSFLNILMASLFSLFLYQGITLMLIVILSMSYSVVIYREFYISLLQKNERNDIISISTFFQGSLAIVFFVAGYFLFGGLSGSFIGILVSRIISVSLIDRRFSKNFGSWGNSSFFRYVSDDHHRRRLLRLFQIGMPMGGDGGGRILCCAFFPDDSYESICQFAISVNNTALGSYVPERPIRVRSTYQEAHRAQFHRSHCLPNTLFFPGERAVDVGIYQ